MPEPLLYLQAVAAAAICSGTFLLVMVAARPAATAAWRSSAAVLGISLGLVVGYSLLSLRVPWPPSNALHRLLAIGLPAVIAMEWIAGLQRVPAWAAWMGRIALALATPRILLHGSVYLTGADADWPAWRAVTTMAVCGSLLAGTWILLSRLALRAPEWTTPGSLSLSTASAGLTVMMAGYVQGGAAALPLAAAVLAATLSAALIPQRGELTAHESSPATATAPASVGIAIVGLFGVVFIGHFFGRLSAPSAAILLLAPLAGLITELPQLRHRNTWLVGALRIALVAIPLAGVLAVAKRDFDRDMAPLLSRAVEPSSLGLPYHSPNAR